MLKGFWHAAKLASIDCRFHPAEVNIRIGQSSAAHAAFALQLKAHAL
jgi:hypothetical protein